MTFLGFTGLLNMLCCIVLGVFVLSRNVRNIQNIAYFVLNFSVALYSFGYMFWQLSSTEPPALFWFKVLMLGIILINNAYLLFVFVFLDVLKKVKLVLSTCYIANLVFIYFNFSGLLFTKLIPRYGLGFWPEPTMLFNAYLVFWFLQCLYGFFLLVREGRMSESHRKVQINYFTIAAILGFLGGATNWPMWYGIPFPPYLNILISLYIGIVAYAIVRHQLLDIEVIIKKTLVFTGLLASIFAILILPTLIIQEYLVRSAGVRVRLIGLIISGIIIIFTMRKIEDFLINITDRYLFQKRYDYKELLKTFTAEVLTVVNLEQLVDLTVSKLIDIVKLNSCAVLLFDDQKQQFNVMASHGIKDPSVTLIRPDGIVTFLEETHGYLLKKELNQKHIFVPNSIQEIIEKLNAELIIPMVLHDEVIGVLSLGKKKSDEDYTQDDIDILLPLARTLAIAISNAELFEELGKTQAEAAQKEKMAVIGTLSAGINHEICNPLGIARGQCEAFLLNIKDGLYNDKSQQELLDKAKDIMAKVIKETDRATAITKKLSSFAKPAKGEAELISITKEVDEVFGLVGYELKLEKIEVEKRIEKDMPNIVADRKQFQEVLFNLVRNAGQAIGEKGKITVSAWSEREKVYIDIKDTGSGIPEDKLKELFNPFFTTKEPGKGTGLGLFIVRQVVEKNGGRIYLKETKVGEGTTFRIEFPAAVTVGARG